MTQDNERREADCQRHGGFCARCGCRRCMAEPEPLAKADAILSLPPPAGWKLVPVEATAEMLSAAYALPGFAGKAVLEAYYRAMLSVSPLVGGGSAISSSGGDGERAATSGSEPSGAEDQWSDLETLAREAVRDISDPGDTSGPWVDCAAVDMFERAVTPDDVIALIEAARAPAAQPNDGWRPIETAPRDGSCILAAWPKSGLFGVIHWEGAEGWIEGDDESVSGATHWQPLPSPPLLRKSEGGGS